jgi:hypothetical protein
MLVLLMSGGVREINVLDIYLNYLVNEVIVHADCPFLEEVPLPGLFTAIGSHVPANSQIGPVPVSLRQENPEERAENGTTCSGRLSSFFRFATRSSVG